MYSHEHCCCAQWPLLVNNSFSCLHKNIWSVFLPNILSLPLSRLIINLLKCRIYQARTFVSCIYCVILRLWFVFFSNCKMFLTLWVWIIINTQKVSFSYLSQNQANTKGNSLWDALQCRYATKVRDIYLLILNQCQISHVF